MFIASSPVRRRWLLQRGVTIHHREVRSSVLFSSPVFADR
jgi:hypothetical protein